jgi:GT2 family glycosyltransferase
MHPSVSIVIPTYNRAKDLKRCLDSLIRQTIKDFEILIVDNGSRDETQELARSYGARILKEREHNLSLLLNLGLREAKGEIVAFLSDDTEPVIGWLEAILEDFKKYKEVSAVGGPAIAKRSQEIMALRQQSKNSWLLRIFMKVYDIVVLEGKFSEFGMILRSGGYSMGGSLPISAKLKNPIYVDLLTVTNVAVRKSVVKTLGGFDERFIQHHTDADLCIRLKANGWKLLFDPKVIVWHHPNPVGPSRRAHILARDYALFYLKDLMPQKVSDAIRMLVNIFYFNAFWLLKAYKTKNIKQLEGIKGFICGVAYYFKEMRKQ